MERRPREIAVLYWRGIFIFSGKSLKEVYKAHNCAGVCQELVRGYYSDCSLEI